MTYNVFGGTLSLTQSINQSCVWQHACVCVCVVNTDCVLFTF